MRQKCLLTTVVATAILFAGVPAWAEDQTDSDALIKALAEATVSLEQGIEAGSREGTPISARYEIEDGVLQLSVYTMNPDQFTEVIVDPRSGRIKESRAITGGPKLKAVAAEGAAMSSTRMSLEGVVGNALRAIPGSRAIGAVAELQTGHPIATTTLVRGQTLREVIETLD
jgi:hypothetical protein